MKMIEQLSASGAKVQRERNPDELACQKHESTVVRLIARSTEDKLLRPITPWFNSEEELEGWLERKLAA